MFKRIDTCAGPKHKLLTIELIVVTIFPNLIRFKD